MKLRIVLEAPTSADATLKALLAIAGERFPLVSVMGVEELKEEDDVRP